ncbi:hypothetical protein H7I77_15455 [Mycolicibacterium novocastrense]|uniref:Uncharacterized protein n=1 Tax=Mycolicibacterium novocastrense TaxID=59813 RepID=A0AAW5SNT6_MYCNV|nr:hypothetical protein [Mycolicibacterium novocastrense]MCV7024727.1 hypothetical protein [Mycolicibacterium novocastrense]GAT12142.1 uncharacterized protein RMCN_5275 [Mycolicibacterium novocastrense]
MSPSTRQADPTLLDRYQESRTRRFLKRERTYANLLPGWRTQSRRRILVVGLAITFASLFVVSVLSAFGLRWAPVLWLGACIVFLPLWTMLQIVSGRQGDAPEAALDEYEVQQRNSARSVGLTITQYLMLIPIGYLLVASIYLQDTDADVAYSGALMSLAVLVFGGCAPAMILGWTRPDPDA